MINEITKLEELARKAGYLLHRGEGGARATDAEWISTLRDTLGSYEVGGQTAGCFERAQRIRAQRVYENKRDFGRDWATMIVWVAHNGEACCVCAHCCEQIKTGDLCGACHGGY